jgi:serine/threonine protein kinase
VTTIIYRDYRVIKEIARGALGIVYLAEKPNNEKFAIKVIQCRQESDKQ